MVEIIWDVIQFMEDGSICRINNGFLLLNNYSNEIINSPSCLCDDSAFLGVSPVESADGDDEPVGIFNAMAGSYDPVGCEQGTGAEIPDNNNHHMHMSSF